MRHALVLLLPFLVPIPLRADWPQWRGRNRDGIAHGARLPGTWPEKPPAPLWKRLIGEGQSSPVVAGDKLCILSRSPEGKEVCWALDAATGKVLWKHDYPCPFKPADARSGDGPKSTPTIDGDRVHALGAAGAFHCFEMTTGKILWKHDLRAAFWGVARDQWGDDAYSTCCGAAASPLVDGSRVILPVGGKKAGAMTAFDRTTGKILWRSPLPDRSSYSSPLVGTLAGRRQVVGFTGLRMGGFSLYGGRLLWDHPFPAEYEQTIITPILWKDQVILGGEHRPTLALKVRLDGPKWTTTTVWSNRDLGLYMSSPVVFQHHLAGLNRRGQIVCLDLATGKTRWKTGNLGTYASLVVAGDHLLALSKDDELHVFAANPDRAIRKARWKLTDHGPTWAHLAVVGSRLFVKDHHHVLCFDLSPR